MEVSLSHNSPNFLRLILSNWQERINFWKSVFPDEAVDFIEKKVSDEGMSLQEAYQCWCEAYWPNIFL